MVINLTGIRESVFNILGHGVANDGEEILQKVLRTAVDVALDQGKHLGDGYVGIAMIQDDSGKRFAGLDSDKYGKISLLPSGTPVGGSSGSSGTGNAINTHAASAAATTTTTAAGAASYSQGIDISGRHLLSDMSDSYLQGCIAIDKLVNGGLLTTVDVTDITSSSEIKTVIERASYLPFFRPRSRVVICSTCGKRTKLPSAEKCEYCKSQYLIPYLQ
jgi:hypothetical protein